MIGKDEKGGGGEGEREQILLTRKDIFKKTVRKG